MYILGINAYHGGASACLIRDGQLVAATEEERFRRVKYWAGFPTEAIRYCLEAGGIAPQDLDHVGISRDPGAHLSKKVMFALRHRPNLGFLTDRVRNLARARDLKTAFCEGLDLHPTDMNAQFHNVEHHRAHLASAFFVSPYEEAAILSVDGMGDFSSTMWGVGRGNKIDVQGSVQFPHSLGYVYTMVCQWLGYNKYGDEGKVMGLAGLGQPEHVDLMRDILRIQRDGTFDLNLDYLRVHSEGIQMTWDDGAPVIGTMYSNKLTDKLGEAREPYSDIAPVHANVAASLQVALEEAEFALVNMLQRKTGQTTLCMAGGVALNSVFNGKIRPETAFDEIYVHPAAGDAGTALGAAYYIYHEKLGCPRTYVMDHAYTGPAYSDDHIASVAKRYDLDCDVMGTDELCQATARRIAAGEVVGWFQGAMEWGPRALGNRSILADPRRTDMKDILNARIKHREMFRPFAPSILLESTGDYFDQDYPDPFMIKVYNVQPDKHEVIPAVTHVDGTGRLQTVDRETAPLYWQIIKEFENLTGVPVVLNTSFNENEPIVCKPEEAVECFLRTKMDTLVMGNHLVSKSK